MMRKFLLAALLLLLCCTTALAANVPASTQALPALPGFPACPQIIRVQNAGNSLTLTLGKSLPSESLVTVKAMDSKHYQADINAAPAGSGTYTAAGLPQGSTWLGIEIAWVSGSTNAVASYSLSGGLEKVTVFDSAFNEYIYDGSGSLTEFAYASTGIRARFDTKGNLLHYGYKPSANMAVWFNLQGEVLAADYDDGRIRATWETGIGWFIRIPGGRISVQLNISPTGYSPLLPPEKEKEEEKVVWYPNNTIGLAGLALQEADSSLPNKWYNVVPINLTQEGRQTYFLVITNNKFIGKCYVDVYGGAVTVSYDLIENGSIEVKSHYGRWFTSLSEITAASIEANDQAIVFGQPMDIETELNGADVALLFIRSKATYRLPFRDGTALAEYWRNKPDWKQFRQDLMLLMPYVDP